MGQSPSKPTTRVATEQLAPATPDNSHPSETVLRPPNESPASPISHSSHRSFVPLQAIRSDSHELEGVARTRRDSDAIVSIDEGSTAAGSVRLQPVYGYPWLRKSQSPLVDRTQHQRFQSGSLEWKSPVTGDLIFEIQPIHEKPSLRIICPLLSSVLKQASFSSLGSLRKDDSFSPTSTIAEPYEWLFHNRRRISQAAQQDTREHTSRHVELLLEFVKKERPSTWEKLDEIDAGNCRKIAFEDIWLLYPPGATVFAKDQGGWRAYKVERVESNSSSLDEMLIYCLYLDLDHTSGKCLTPKREVLTVSIYSSELPIGDLEVVPDWYFQDRNGLFEKLLKRGRRFWEYTRTVSHKEYSGQAWPRSSRQDSTKIVIDYITSSRHMNIQQTAPSRICCGATCFTCLGETLGLRSYPVEAPHDSDVCTRVSQNVNREVEGPKSIEHSLLFCPSRMWAFSLKHKSWELILPEDVDDVQYQTDALDQLILKADDKKKLEAALHTYQIDESVKNGDSIDRGNQGGLSILLHGNPGTGKTFTAECLAARHGIPLYKITCADLSTDLDALKKRLQETCLRAANWKALLLLDEADMFVQTRDMQDLHESEALLFITSGRVDRLDQALESRITMPIHLPDLSFEVQQSIWKDLIWRLENPSPDQKKVWERFIKFDLEAAEGGVYTTMNGRQIKTCITAALTLARLENESLEITHVREILRMGREFRELLQADSDDPRDRFGFLTRKKQQQAQRSVA
ncbi:P-loop containing nucleoside triphosphate hydrolase protein [Xylaria curta]|nr:P-loop containing nucleoside triphosphate hydrolase protein [Xylaria curta]